MGFNNPKMPWSELNRRLSGQKLAGGREPKPTKVAGDGGDSPAWSFKRSPYLPPDQMARHRSATPYAELHCHSNFSFLDGASFPEELAEEAARLDLKALAITDHNGFYGVVRFAEAARAVGLPTVFGAELTLGIEATPAVPSPDPAGNHLVVLARDPVGYARLARAISLAQMNGEKGAPRLTFEQLAEAATAPLAPQAAGSGVAGSETTGHWHVLTGCRKGTVPSALVAEGPAAARRELRRLTEVFGRDGVSVEIWDHGDPLDSARNDAMVDVAAREGVEVVATGNVHYANPSRRKLATALAAVRSRRSLDELEGWLPASAAACLRNGDEQAARFARYPGVVERAAEMGLEFALDLHLVAPELPPYPVPEGHTEATWLRELTWKGAERRYGPRDNPRVPNAHAQIEHELDLIAELNFPGYFLIVYDLVEFCRQSNIYCQGRGSAANSAVCYSLGITNADPISLGLLFERFLSPARDGPPDIDIDIESGRREEVIQYVYERHGRHYAAQVANVITYRARSSVRDMAKALGFATGQQDAWSKQVDAWGNVESTAKADDHSIPESVLELAAEVEHFPRHLGIHSGGMVLCDRPIIEVCPVEWGRMEDRSVLQWDKDDGAAAGLVKFDLLGLGMLSAIHYSVDFIKEAHGVEVDIALLPQEDDVYDMICAADTVGVFQIESRGQMATLPRLRPRCFYDLVVEVALIRPGPIQGGSVHPYIRRRHGKEPITYLHPAVEPALKKTLGVPLFQEQLMQIAIDIAGFSPAEADELRQAMGSKRSVERMERLKGRLYLGMAERGITGETADIIFDKMVAFANYGFPESHAASFAYLVYASCWLKHYYPAAFCAALINAQPMGFYSPHSLVQDARRHGVIVNTPDINISAADATLEPEPKSTGGVAVRLGISSVRNVGDDLAEAIAAARPFRTLEDLARRANVPLPALEALATSGALDGLPADNDHPEFGKLTRRQALWAVGAVAQGGVDKLEGIVTGDRAPRLPGMTPVEEMVADMWATGVSPDGHPTKFVRQKLDELGVLTATGLRDAEHQSKVWVAGVVTHRQRPATAGGTMFINLEDETGLINVIASKGCWIYYGKVARSAPAMLVRGRLEKVDNVINVVAEKLDFLPVSGKVQSRNFR